MDIKQVAKLKKMMIFFLDWTTRSFMGIWFKLREYVIKM